MTGKETGPEVVCPAYFEIKVAESSSDYPKVSIVGEFVVAKDHVNDRIKSIDKETIERLIMRAIADFTEIIPASGGDKQ